MSGAVPGYHRCGGGIRLACRLTAGRSPGVMYLCGFRSDISGAKVHALERHCARRGLAFTCFDHRGHGASSGRIEDCTPGLWLEDALEILDTLTGGPQVLVGASMGAWLMCLLAWRRPERVSALIGIGSALDFPAGIERRLDAQQRRELLEQGRCFFSSPYSAAPYLLSRAMLDSAAQIAVREPLRFAGPVRLLHGMRDAEVPWQECAGQAARFEGPDIELRLLPHGDHRLSTAPALAALRRVLDEVTGDAGA